MSPDGDAPLPIAQCYRVLPHGVLAGEYPGSTRKAEAQRKLESLLDAGVRVFVDLTEAGEHGLHPYDGLLRQLASQRSLPVEHRRFAIPDVSTPGGPGRMTETLDAIEDAVRAQRGVYVHCYGGVGRTGLTVACLFVRLGLTADEALAHLARLWRSVPKSARKPRSPETDAQADWVRRWSEGRVSRRARTRGALLGLAAGDALGTTLEFERPGSFDPIHDIVGGGPFRLEPGEWTDDTSMALCLASSLLECRGFDAADQMRRYRRWQTQGFLSSNGRCFDIGNTVAAALGRFADTGDPLAGSTSRKAAGNGSLMRLAPVPLFYATDPEEAVRRAALSSRTTHGAPQAVDACAWMAAAIAGALEGRAKAEVLGPHTLERAQRALGRDLDDEIRPVAEGSFARRSPPEIRGSGFVVESLEAALWALHTTEDFERGALAAVNLGLDADTTGAIYGQLAGALYGEEGIPRRWRAVLAKRAQIETLAEGLFRQAHGFSEPPAPDSRREAPP